MRFASMSLWLAAACGRLDFGGAAHDAATRDAIDGTAMIDADGGCPGFALFCDGFESGDLSKWTAEDLPASQQVTADAHYTGMYGLDSAVGSDQGAGGEGDVYLVPGQTFATGTLAVREWVYSPAQLVNYIGTLEVTLGAPATASQYLEVNANDVGAWSLSEFGSAGLHDQPGGIVAATATWTCVELVVELGSAASATIYVDGAASSQGALSNTGDSYDTIAVGVTRANAGGFEIFIDDVAIATQRIGC
ncbi:MAG TPA: hypothetical protein VGG74_29410 [Kofleriaceae bacterium]|jgi:hypothetical protein